MAEFVIRHPKSSFPEIFPEGTVWSKCLLCENESGEKLVNPTSDGCTKLASNIRLFHKIGAVPLGVNISRLDDGLCLNFTMASTTNPAIQDSKILNLSLIHISEPTRPY